MRRSEALLLSLIALFIFWILACVFHPFVGLIILCIVFAGFLGFFFFTLIAIIYSRNK